MHTLISDGGSMTVGRRTANYVWGAFEVVLPEGQEQADAWDERIKDGYVYRPDDRGHGRAELTFVRADARIDMDADKSDLEQTLDGASERTKGDAYYTRQISGVGLGRTRPGVDYKQGDVVRVRVWSRYLELPVTAIISSRNAEGSSPDAAVQVGGQMLRDAEALRKRNDDIDSQIAAEKRQRLRQVGAVDKKASSALGETAELREALAGEGATTEDLQEQLEALNQQLQEAGEGTGENLPLIQAYISANTARWELQQRVDEMQDRVSEELQAQQIAMKEEFEQDRANRTEKVIASAAGSSNPAHPVTVLPDGRWQLSLNGVAGTTVVSDTWELAGQDRINPIYKQYSPTSGVFRVTRNSNQTVACEWVRTPGVVRSVNDTWTGKLWLDNANQWYSSSAAPEIIIGPSGTDNFDMTVTIRWPSGWGYYRTQIRAGDVVLADKEARGSSTIFESYPLTVTLSVSNATIPPNTEIKIYSSRRENTSLGGAHQYNRLVTRASWTERNV